MRPKPILVVAAHPDDEALGCGGTIARWVDEGAEVHLAFMADGIGARIPGPEEERALHQRRDAANSAANILGATSVKFDDLPDNQLDSIPLLDIAQGVEALINRYQPETVLTHHAGDLNIDHRRVHQAVMTACRPQSGHPVKTLLCFEVMSSTEWQPACTSIPFEPHWYVDISTTLDRKLAALDAYSEEMRPWPHPRSIKAVDYRARWHGATIGCEAAEAFMLARKCQ